MKRQIIFIFMLLSATLGSMARQPERGYRGFLDWSNSLRSDKFIERYTTYYSGVSTSHGFQFTPWLYVGGGLNWEHHSDSDSNILAVFVDGRTDLKFGKFTPFGDVRLGFSMTDGGGIYFSPTIGYRFNWGRKVGINLGIGLTLKGISADINEYIYTDDGYLIVNKIGTSHWTNSYFSFRLGFDF